MTYAYAKWATGITPFGLSKERVIPIAYRGSSHPFIPEKDLLMFGHDALFGFRVGVQGSDIAPVAAAQQGL